MFLYNFILYTYFIYVLYIFFFSMIKKANRTQNIKAPQVKPINFLSLIIQNLQIICSATS